MCIENTYKEMLQNVHSSVLKPLGWKKDRNSFRLYGDDGLCKVINFQRARWNTSQKCKFYINMGVYMEKTCEIEKRKFYEYECQIRERTKLDGGIYELNCAIDNAAVQRRILEVLRAEALPFLDSFYAREQVIKLMLSGEIEEYTRDRVMHYSTCKLLFEMGYAKEVLPIVRAIKADLIQNGINPHWIEGLETEILHSFR